MAAIKTLLMCLTKNIYIFFQFCNTTGCPVGGGEEKKRKEYISLFSNTVSVWCAAEKFWVSAKFRGKSKALIKSFSFK